jgi:hypothetical protein
VRLPLNTQEWKISANPKTYLAENIHMRSFRLAVSIDSPLGSVLKSELLMIMIWLHVHDRFMCYISAPFASISWGSFLSQWIVNSSGRPRCGGAKELQERAINRNPFVEYFRLSRKTHAHGCVVARSHRSGLWIPMKFLCAFRNSSCPPPLMCVCVCVCVCVHILRNYYEMHPCES